MTNEKRRAEVSKFQRVTQILISVFIIPVLIVAGLSIYIFSSSKANSSLPTGFGNTVIEISETFDNFTRGEKVLVLSVDQNQILEGDYVAFYVASEEPGDTGGSLISFKKVLNIIDDNGVKSFGFSNEQYFQIEDSIIGVYKGESPILMMLLEFFSLQTAVIFVGLLPLFILLVFLGLDIVEQFSIRDMNRELDIAFLRAGSAGFDTSAIEEETRNDEIKSISTTAIQKNAPKSVVQREGVKMPSKPLPPAHHVKPTLANKKPSIPPMPPKAGPKPPLPPKK